MEKYRLVQENKADGTEDFPEAAAYGGNNSPAAGSSSSATGSSIPEVRITQQGKPRNYITYAMNKFVRIRYYNVLELITMCVFFLHSLTHLFFLSLKYIQQADGSPTIVLTAMGRAINKAVTIAEILKRKMPLHQLNSLSSVEMVDVFEPVEEGLDVVTSRRYVSCMRITLSLTDADMDKEHSGYQPPLPEDDIHPGDYHSMSRTSSPIVST